MEGYHIDRMEQAGKNATAGARDILALHLAPPPNESREPAVKEERDSPAELSSGGRGGGELARVQHIFLQHLVGGIDFDQ